MNLPFILDVTLGLVFIYLIFSLLASEIQELIATVFQWRAEHLKKSIEILLAGELQNSEEIRVIQLANQIYANPLIRNINQEAKGLFTTIPRKITWAIGAIYRSVKKTKPGMKQNETTFGGNKHSGPSYIPADIFATTLVETLQIPTLVQKLTEHRFEKFKNSKLAEIQDIILLIQPQENSDEYLVYFFNHICNEFVELQAEFNKNIEQFKQKKASLTTTLNRMAESLEQYIETFQIGIPENELYSQILRKLKNFKKDNFDDLEYAISIGGLRPNINEVVQTINISSAVYQECEASFQNSQNDETFQVIKRAIETLPPSVVENLAVLAKRAQVRVKNTEEGINALRLEIENTFNSSMERASGVYKRNAKGVAILIGLVVAASANADAFHMINRLSKDSALRDTITNSAGEVLIRNSPAIINLDELRNEADRALTDIALPIGWTDVNLRQQMNWTRQSKQAFPMMKMLTVIPGWIISGLAIAMGAPFWFDLLGKVVNVRNAGTKPSHRKDENQ